MSDMNNTKQAETPNTQNPGVVNPHQGLKLNEDVSKPSKSFCDLGRAPIVTEDVFAKRDRPLMSTGAIDTFVSSFSFKEPVAKATGSNTKLDSFAKFDSFMSKPFKESATKATDSGTKTDSFSKFDSFMNKFQKSGMHTSKVSSLNDAALGLSFGKSKPMSVVLHKTNLEFGGTQQTNDEALINVDKSKYASRKTKCKVGNRNADGTVEFCCGKCEFCLKYVTKFKPTTIITKCKNYKPISAKLSGKLFTKDKRNSFKIAEFFKNSKTLSAIMRKNECAHVKFSQHPASMVQLYGSTNAKGNTKDSMLGRDKGIEFKMKDLTVNFINYVKYAFNNQQLSHYIDLKLYTDWVTQLKKNPKKLFNVPGTIESSKMFTHRGNKDIKDGGLLLYKAVMKTCGYLGCKGVKELFSTKCLTARKINNVCYIRLPEIGNKLDEYIMKEIFKKNMIGAMLFGEMLDGTKESLTNSMKAHKCKKCDGINVLGLMPTGINYNNSTTERRKMFNIVKYACHENKDFAFTFTECRLSRIEELTGLKTNEDKFYQLCSFCGSNFLNDGLSLFETIKSIIVYKLTHTPMGLLHHLEKLGYLDGAALDATGERMLIAMDYKTMQHQMSRLRQDVVALPAKLDNESFRNLQDNLVELEFCRHTSPSLTESCIYATTKAILTLSVNINEHQNFVSLTNDSYMIEGVKPSNLLRSHKSWFESSSQTIDVVSNNGQTSGLICTSIMQYHPNVIAGVMKENKIKKIFATIIETPKQNFKVMCSGELQCTKIGSNFFLITNWCDRPITISEKMFNAWNADYLITNNGSLTIELIRKCNDLMLVEINLNKGECYQPRKIVNAIENVIVEVPLLMWYNTKSGMKFSLMGRKKLSLNREVYRRMMIRNISGDNSYKELVEYGLALANMKYTINDRVINLQDVTAETIKYTAAFVYIKMLDVQTNLHLTSKLIQTQGSIKGIMLSLIITQIETFLSMLNLDNSIVHLAKTFAQSHKSSMIMGDTQLNDMLIDVDELMCYSREPKIFDFRNFDIDINKIVPDCPHVGERDVDVGPNRCKCCDIGKIFKNNLCRVCNVSDGHDCNHQCVSNHEVGDQVCSCCKCKTNFAYCPCCQVTNIEDYQYVKPDETKDDTEKPSKPKQWKPSEYKDDGDWPKIRKLTSKERPEINQPELTLPKEATVSEPAESVAAVLKERESINESESLRLRLMKHTSELYADLFTFGTTAWENHESSLAVPNHQTLTSYLTLIPMGESTMSQADVVIEKYFHASGEGLLCGIDSLRTLYPNEIFEMSIIRELTKENNNYSSDHLGLIAKQYSLNLIVIQPEWCLVIKCVENDEFKAIVHSKALPEPMDIDHWQPCVVRQRKNSMSMPYWPNHFNDDDRENERRKQGLKVRITAKLLGNINLLKLEVGLFEEFYKIESKPMTNMFTTTIKSGLKHITNNTACVNNPALGLFSSKVTLETAELCEGLLECFINPIGKATEDWYYDRPEEIGNNVSDGLLALGKQMIKSIAQIMCIAIGDTGFNSMVSSHIVVPYKKVNNSLCRIDIVDKTKPGDIIIGHLLGIQSEDFVENNVVLYVIKKLADAVICSGQNLPKATKIKIKSLKQNTGSCFRTLFSIMKWEHNDQVESLIQNCRAIDAVAGWGKTTEIKNLTTNETTIVAQTSSAVENLKKNIQTANRICSIEKAIVDKVVTKKLIIDEASMVTWEILSLICSKNVKELVILGNTSQICVIDMFQTRGLRSAIDILSSKRNREVYLGSHRIGNPLAQELGRVAPGFHSLTDKETKYCVISWSEPRWDEINDIVNDGGRCTILCFYNNAVRIVKTKLTRVHEVTTVHKFQGKEDDKVVVLQWSPHGNTPGRISLDRHQCFSAATRAKKELIWISINEYSGTVPLYQRFGTVSGGFKPMEKLIKLMDLVVRASSMIKAKNLNNFRELGVDVLIKEPNETIKYKKLTATLNDYLNLVGVNKTKLERTWWWSKPEMVKKTSEELMNELLKYQVDVKDEAKQIHPEVIKSYNMVKKMFEGMENMEEKMIEFVKKELSNVAKGATANINYDSKKDEVYMEIRMLGVNQATINLNFKANKGSIETGPFSMVGKNSQMIDEILIGGETEKKFDDYEAKLENKITIKKTYASEKMLWYINYFGPIIENGGLSFIIETKRTRYHVESLAGCSLCGGLLVYKNKKLILMIRPSYDTYEYREIFYPASKSHDVSVLLNFFKMYRALEDERLSFLDLTDVVTYTNINLKGKKFLIFNLLVERMILVPTMIKSMLMQYFFQIGGDICDKYDNVNHPLVDSHVARLKAMGVTDINNKYTPWFYTDCSRRPYLCKYMGRVVTCYIDTKSNVWVAPHKEGFIRTDATVTTLSGLTDIIVKDTIVNPLLKPILSLLGMNKMGAKFDLAPLLRPISEHNANNDIVAGVAKKFFGQMEAKTYQYRTDKLYMTINMQQQYPDITGHMGRFYNIIMTTIPYPENNLKGLLELIVTQAIQKTKLFHAIYLTTNPCCAILSGNYNWYSTVLPSEKYEDAWRIEQFESRKFYNLGILGNIEKIVKGELSKLLEKKEFTEEEKNQIASHKTKLSSIDGQIKGESEIWYGDYSARPEHVNGLVVGFDHLSSNPRELSRVMKENNITECFIMAPSMDTLNATRLHKVEKNNGSVTIMFKDSNNVINVNSELFRMIHAGVAINDVDGTTLWTETISTMYGIQVIKFKCGLTKLEAKLMVTELFSPFNGTLEVEKVFIQYPRLLLSPFDGNTKNLIIEKKIVSVNKRLARKMFERAAYEDAGLEELLKYGRSYLQTQLYTEKYVATINKDKLDELHAISLAALSEKYGINDQLEETMKLISNFKLTKEDGVLKSIAKLNIRKTIEVLNSKMSDLKNWIGVPDSIQEWLDSLGENSRILFRDENETISEAWQIGETQNIEEKFKMWWQRTKVTTEWMQCGYYEIKRKVITNKRNLILENYTDKLPSPLADMVRMGVKAMKQTTERRPDHVAEITSCPEPIALVGESNLIDVLNRGVVQDNGKHEKGDTTRFESLTRSLQSLPNERLTTARLILNGVAQLSRSLSAKEWYQFITTAISNMWMELRGDTKNWRSIEELQKIVGMENLNLEEVKMISKYIQENETWETMRKEAKPSKSVRTIAEEMLVTMSMEECKSLCIIKSTKPSIVMNTTGASIELSVAQEIRKIIRENWIKDCDDKLAMVADTSLMEELNIKQVNIINDNDVILDAELEDNCAYDVSCENQVVKFNPTQNRDCVWQCISMFLNDNKLSFTETEKKNIRSLTHSKEMLNEVDLRKVSSLLNINLLLIDEDTNGKLYVINKENKIMTLGRIRQLKGIDHCVLLRNVTINIGKKLESIEEDSCDLNWNTICNIDKEFCLPTKSLNINCNDHLHLDANIITNLIGTLVEKEKIESIEGSMQLPSVNNLLPRLTRKVRCITTLIKLKGTNSKWYEMDEPISSEPGSLMLVKYGRDWKLVMVVNSTTKGVNLEEKMIIKLNENVGHYTTMINLGVKIIEFLSTRTTGVPEFIDEEMGSINNETANYLMCYKNMRCPVVNNPKILHIYHYDNRNHHKYDDRDKFIDRSIDSIVLHHETITDIPNNIIIQCMKERGLIRACLLQGKLKLITYCGSKATQKVTDWIVSNFYDDIVYRKDSIIVGWNDNLELWGRINAVTNWNITEDTNNRVVIEVNNREYVTMEIDYIINDLCSLEYNSIDLKNQLTVISAEIMDVTNRYVKYHVRPIRKEIAIERKERFLDSGFVYDGKRTIHFISTWTEIIVEEASEQDFVRVSKHTDYCEVLSEGKDEILPVGEPIIKSIELKIERSEKPQTTPVNEDDTIPNNMDMEVKPTTDDYGGDLLGVIGNEKLVDEEGLQVEGASFGDRWKINYNGIEIINPGWWYIKFPKMRDLEIYTKKHDIKINMAYGEHKFYRLNRIRFREPASTFVHSTVPETVYDVLKYKSNLSHKYPEELQRIADTYLHGKVSWHAVLGENYNKSFSYSINYLTKRFDKVIVVTDYTDCYVNNQKLVLIKTNKVDKPLRSTIWRLMILFANISDDCTLFIGNGRGLDELGLEMLDRVMEESQEDFDIVSALHVSAFPVCAGCAKYNHKVFTDYSTFLDLYTKYGDNYGCDEIYLSRYRVKMMWLYYLSNGNACYSVEGKWQFHANNNSFIIEARYKDGYRVDNVKGMYCIANFFKMSDTTRGIYDFSSYNWKVRELLWKKAMTNQVQHEEPKWWNKDSSVKIFASISTPYKMEVERIKSLINNKETDMSKWLTEFKSNLNNTILGVDGKIELVNFIDPKTSVCINIDTQGEVIQISKEMLEPIKASIEARNNFTDTVNNKLSWKLDYWRCLSIDSAYGDNFVVTYDLIKMFETCGVTVFNRGCTKLSENSWLLNNDGGDPNLIKLKTLNPIIKDGNIMLSCEDKNLTNVLNIHDRILWKDLLLGIAVDELIRFDKRIAASYADSEPTELKRKIGEIMSNEMVQEAIRNDCTDHVECKDRLWHEMKKTSCRVAIRKLEVKCTISDRTCCVQKNIQNDYNVLCQGVTIKFLESKKGKGEKEDPSSVIKTPREFGSWQQKLNEEPKVLKEFGTETHTFSIEEQKIQKEEMRNRRIQLNEFHFKDAYALIHHNLADINRVSEFGTEINDDVELSWDIELIDPIKSKLNLSGLETNCRFKDLNVKVIDLWDDTDLRDWVTTYGPKNPIKVKSKAVPGHKMISVKTILTQHPSHSRSVLTKAYGSELNAVTGRLGSVLTLRKENLDIRHEVDNFKKAYFKQGYNDLLKSYQVNKLTINDSDIKDWLAKRKDWLKLAKSTIKLLEEGLPTNPMNKVNVHVKTESLLKSNPIQNWRQTQSRIIVWQPKELCALMSPVFLRVKQRLKDTLRHEILYTDGLTPDMISNRLRAVDYEYIFEDDLEKQDRQTDQQLIDVEFQIMLLLGLDEKIASLWRLVHRRWRYKGKEASGEMDAMRLTGQATTALGNVITNLCVHSRFVIEHKLSLNMMLVLGDDNIMFLKSNPNLKNYKRDMKDKYNMISKPLVSENVGTFCSLICYKTKLGTAECGPDFVRMRRRFEVTGGGNHRELPLMCINIGKMEVEIPKNYKGRNVVKLFDITDNELENWSKLHGNKSIIVVTNNNLRSTKFKKIYNADNTSIEENLEKVHELLGPPNPVMAKSMSYLHMIGKSEETEETLEKLQIELQLIHWYDMEACKIAVAVKYGMTMEEVEDNISALLQMITNPIPIHKEFVVITNQ
nr:MAG: RNA-dependent RNA polymerase [Alphaendornavirus sp. 'monocotyledonae']